MKLVETDALTKGEYRQLSPFSKGYVSYMQAAWNHNVPRKCIYREGTKRYKQWCDGAQLACLHAQDGDDE